VPGSALDLPSAVIINDQAVVLMSARRYPEAFAAARRALELDSTFTYTRAVLAWLHGVTGRRWPPWRWASAKEQCRDSRGAWSGTSCSAWRRVRGARRCSIRCGGSGAIGS